MTTFRECTLGKCWKRNRDVFEVGFREFFEGHPVCLLLQFLLVLFDPIGKKLIYYEHYRDVRDAIARESQLKKWSRAKKVNLISRLNPGWEDLGADVLQDR